MSTITGSSRSAASTRSKVVAMYIALGLINVFAWGWAYAVLRASPALIGAAFLAYSFGLRHAMDADHIAAIDNVTRNLMNDGKRPVSVGFFFALGHSLTVVVGAVVVALATKALAHHFDAFRQTGAIVGSVVSASFLLAIGVLNLVLLADLVRAFRRMKGGRTQEIGDPRLLQFDGNLLARVFKPLFRFVRSSWLMLPLGMLFGIGFETATEVALLGTSASQASEGLSMWTILVFPCLFAAGMLTVDTTDGILMLGAYGWAFVKPLRKLYYNLTITLISTVVALLIGGIEALGIAGQVLSLSGPFWHFVGTLNDNFGALGYAIVGIFIAGWIVSALLYKIKGYDRDVAAV
ncbi:HoxN/HupN/NixA family nickel/cobalt transporter [Paraburkholderia sp. SOS3]|jgi:high-affinity nickel-transport protein|uniref:HoxN/HupN/NixA family nickel/cobalt transporter n=1 Tax=Paraburkholderia sp. SOS3 TaxID=1926494 RepID=UPI0009472ED2|nr:HoxN/HupN/NixA family nickel/cobalt transporter [Paraburkholderia sp. SOS3]APR38512.1 nickel transporter [Paraburkholderia sp. SOS3]